MIERLLPKLLPNSIARRKTGQHEAPDAARFHQQISTWHDGPGQ